MMRSEVGERPKTPLRTTGLNFLATLGELNTTRDGVNHSGVEFERSGPPGSVENKTESSSEREQCSNESTYSDSNALIIM